MLTARDNFVAFFSGKDHDYTPVWEDIKTFYPEEVPENIARGFIWQQQPFDRDRFGGKGFFGVDWVFDPAVGGSIETRPLFDDIADWRRFVSFPNLDMLDWDGMKARNESYLDTDKIIRTSIFSGFYERLISFVGFENAAMALVDEDALAEVHEIFGQLCDLYSDFIHRMHKYCNVELFELHDDWGTQNSTMFSRDTLTEAVLPYVKRVADAAHKEGCLLEMHSCGHVDAFIPCMIEAGVDTWRGQTTAVDRSALIREYSDRFNLVYEFNVEDETVPLEQILEDVRRIKDKFRDKKVWYMVSMLTDKRIAREIYDELKR